MILMIQVKTNLKIYMVFLKKKMTIGCKKIKVIWIKKTMTRKKKMMTIIKKMPVTSA